MGRQCHCCGFIIVVRAGGVYHHAGFRCGKQFKYFRVIYTYYIIYIIYILYTYIHAYFYMTNGNFINVFFKSC